MDIGFIGVQQTNIKLSFKKIENGVSLSEIRNFFDKNGIDFRPLDLAREQGGIRFKSGAYTIVREHFESDSNTAIGQEMTV